MGAPWRPRGPDDLDDDQRARIRRRVLEGVRPRLKGRADRLYEALAVLALPAPHLIRAIVSVAVVVAVVGTATVASADALPDEPLYGMKVASEQVRLAMARTPEDRAAVELSMAEHRLSEAERLALAGRQLDALIATSAYGTHLANAAAELAAVERLEAAARPVVEQLKQRLAEQQKRAAEVAARLIGDPVTAAGASVFRSVASFAPPLPSGASIAEGIAEHAASVAGQLAAVADRLAAEAEQAEEEDEEDEEEDERGMDVGVAPPPPTRAPAAAAPAAARTETPRATLPRATQTARPTTPRRTEPPRAAGPTAAAAAQHPDATRAGSTARPTAKASAKPTRTVDPKKAAQAQAARAAAEKAKAEAAKARIAAEKAKEAAKKTASPKPTPKQTPKR